MKIGVVGAGMVGSCGAYAMVMQGVGNEIVLVDLNMERAKAEAQDISHAAPFAKPVRVRAGDYSDLKGAGIVVLAAGVAAKGPGESRLVLLERNAEVFRQIIPQVLKYAPDAILIVATNPVDIITHIVTDISGLPPTRVIGTGTILDTARFRSLLSEHLGVSSQSIHAYVLGEHGDSEVLHWSGACVGTVPLREFAAQNSCAITDDIVGYIEDGTRFAAQKIIKGKGATWYGIGAGISRIAKAIIDDQHSVLTCSIVTPDIAGVKDVAVSLPRIVSRNGVGTTMYPSLNPEEQEALHKSAGLMKKIADDIL